MNYLEILKELDKSLEKQIKQLNKTNWIKRHVVCDRLKSALVHVKRELRKEV
jgi:DNA-binding TFAR19-related protein (PDSD5 family)